MTAGCIADSVPISKDSQRTTIAPAAVGPCATATAAATMRAGAQPVAPRHLTARPIQRHQTYIRTGSCGGLVRQQTAHKGKCIVVCIVV